METLFGVAAGTALVVYIFVSASNAKRKKQDALQAIANALGGTVTSSNSVGGRRQDVNIVYMFADRGVGSSHEPWTEVSAVLPARYPLTIRIVRGQPKPNQHVVDIELGTPAFDDFFIVEAAPADVVRQLIDEPARMFLTRQHGKVELETVAGGLRISTPGWIEDPSHARGLADYVGLLASRVRDAYAAANAKVAPRDLGSPYRPQVSVLSEDLQAAREHEIAQVHQVQALRAEQQARMNAMIMWLVVGIIVVIAVAISIA